MKNTILTFCCILLQQSLFAENKDWLIDGSPYKTEVNLSSDKKHKSRKTKSDGREKRKAIFEAKTKCAQKSRLFPPSGQNTSVVQTPFESCLNDAFY